MSVTLSWFRKDSRVLVPLCLASAALCAFALLASQVLEGRTHAFDESILLALRTPGDSGNPIGPSWLELALVDITSLGSTTIVVLATLLAFGYCLARRRRCEALLLLAAIGSGIVLSMVLKAAVGRPRPDLVSHLVHIQTLSFPSSHAMLSSLTYLTLAGIVLHGDARGPVRTYIWTAAVLLIVLIGFSRVFLGVHWPTDVLAGWSLGAAWAMLWLIVAVRFCKGAPQPLPQPTQASANTQMTTT